MLSNFSKESLGRATCPLVREALRSERALGFQNSRYRSYTENRGGTHVMTDKAIQTLAQQIVTALTPVISQWRERELLKALKEMPVSEMDRVITRGELMRFIHTGGQQLNGDNFL